MKPLKLDLDEVDTGVKSLGKANSPNRDGLSSLTPHVVDNVPRLPDQNTSSNQVIIRTIMTKTTIREYPSGQKFYDSSTWEVGAKPFVRKAKKKKKITEFDVKVGDVEEY